MRAAVFGRLEHGQASRKHSIGSRRPAHRDETTVAGDEFEALDDEVDQDAEAIEVEEVPAPVSAKQKLRDKRAKEKALIKEALANAKQGISEEELEARRSRLKQLIKLGKDRGFLTVGGVLNDSTINAYIALKEQEITRFSMTPHPVEFEMYYSL